MPLISQFYGILIYIYKEIGGHHNEPHIHVKYNEYEMSMTINCKFLNGNIPKKQRRLVEAWIELHKDEIRKSWDAYNSDGQIIKIKGLE